MTRATYCCLEQAGCAHDRCRRMRQVDPVCEAGHPLDVDGMCQVCDAIDRLLEEHGGPEGDDDGM